MCGLVGIAGDLAYRDEATMKRLLLFDFFRGPDSTGLASVRTNNDIKLAKIDSDPITFFDSQKFKDALNGNQSKVLIGHNRSATRGAVTTVNAHPFRYGDIVGAHNGTLDIASQHDLEEALGEKYGSDSAAVFAAIDKLGIEDTMKMVREGRDSQTGAWSFVWFDVKDNTLNFLRNKHRPLWYSFSEDYKRMYWASEWAMIEGANRLSTHGYDLAKDAEGNRFWATDADVLYKFDVDSLKKGGKTRPKPRVRELKGKEPASAVSSSYDPFSRKEGTMTTVPHTTVRHGTSGTSVTTVDKEIIILLGSGDDPFAGVISEEKFKTLVRDGCSYCSRDIEWGDRGITVFERDDVVLCACCTNKDNNSQRVHVEDIAPFEGK